MALEKIYFGADLSAYVAGPKKAPAIIVLQEWWGITDEIKQQAVKISKEGYRVLVPDIYKGVLGVDKEEASHLMHSLDFEQAVREIKQAVDLLRDEGSPKVGVVGFCMGAALIFLLAQENCIDAAAPLYGTPWHPQFQKPQFKPIEQVPCPVQAHTGANDHHFGFSDPAAMQLWVDYVNKGGGSAELFVYEGCGHGFMNETAESKKRMQYCECCSKIDPADQRQLAWDRLFAFFAKNLRPEA